MTDDPTEEIRRQEQAELNSAAAEREVLEKTHGKVWSTDELRADFEVLGFMAPYVVARQRSTGKKGSLQFQHSPRYYFNWVED
jgi:hypothetical protein